MYECNVTSAIPGTETATTAQNRDIIGRPWQPTTSEVVFYNTTIETSDFPVLKVSHSSYHWHGKIHLVVSQEVCMNMAPQKCQVKTILHRELLGQLYLRHLCCLMEQTSPLSISMKGTDGWDPIPLLIEKDQTSAVHPVVTSAVKVTSLKSEFPLVM